MKRTVISILAAVLAGACFAEEQTVKLSLSADKAISQMTGASNWISTDKSGIMVFGKEYKVEAKYKSGVCYLGIDADGSGSVSSKEIKKFRSRAFKPYTVSFKANVGGKECNLPIIITDAWISSRGSSSVTYQPAWAMSGKIDGQTVYFVNKPEDSEFSCRNTYYAAKSLYLIPLRPGIFINGKFYKASMKEDGSEITLKEVEQSGFGKFSFKYNMRGCQCLILANDDWSFDLMDSTIKSVPDGNFELRNCTYGTKTTNIRSSGRREQVLTFKDDSENIITMGAPFTYYVKATLNGDTVQVEPTNSIMGCGGEVYSFDGSNSKTPPTVMIYVGRKCSSKGRMEFG